VLQEHQSGFVRATLLNGPRQEFPRVLQIARLIGRYAVVQQLLGFTLAFGKGAAGPLDVRARTSMSALEERDACPDVDRLFVIAAEVVIEARQQQVLDARGAIGVAGGADSVGTLLSVISGRQLYRHRAADVLQTHADTN
jgi:hypothetical protein